MLKNAKFCLLGTKNKRIFFIQIKTSDFILQKQKQKNLYKYRD
jgi:hypothetical protein